MGKFSSEEIEKIQFNKNAFSWTWKVHRMPLLQ